MHATINSLHIYIPLAIIFDMYEPQKIILSFSVKIAEVKYFSDFKYFTARK